MQVTFLLELAFNAFRVIHKKVCKRDYDSPHLSLPLFRLMRSGHGRPS